MIYSNIKLRILSKKTWRLNMIKVLRYLISTTLAVTPSVLFAESFTLDCTRNRVDTSAYTDAAAADSWHPYAVTPLGY